MWIVVVIDFSLLFLKHNPKSLLMFLFLKEIVELPWYKNYVFYFGFSFESKIKKNSDSGLQNSVFWVSAFASSFMDLGFRWLDEEYINSMSIRAYQQQSPANKNQKTVLTEELHPVIPIFLGVMNQLLFLNVSI